MSENCNHECEGCGESCDHRIKEVKPNEYSKIKKIIGVISGKGGVGKSFVSSAIAVNLQKRGNRVAILDADITGPSIPKTFGIKEKANGDGKFLYPALSQSGIQIISANMLLENDDDPILWRGPMIADLVKQFYTEVIWKDVDYMIIDMPPGTGDVALSTFQSLPVDGIVIITTPQDLVSVIVKKAIKMATMMNIKILGLVENMSFIKCPDCNKRINLFGESKILDIAKEYSLSVLAQLGIDQQISKAVDAGRIEDIDVSILDEAVQAILKI